MIILFCFSVISKHVLIRPWQKSYISPTPTLGGKYLVCCGPSSSVTVTDKSHHVITNQQGKLEVDTHAMQIDCYLLKAGV